MGDKEKQEPATGAEDKPDADGMTTDAGRRAIKAERDRAKDLQRQIDELKPLADAAKEAADKDKPEIQRLTEQVAGLTRDRDAATADRDRFKVALDHKLTATQAKRLVGANVDELTADAAELVKDLGGSSTSTDDDTGQQQERAPGNRTESLQGGNDPTRDEPGANDVRDAVDAAMKSGF